MFTYQKVTLSLLLKFICLIFLSENAISAEFTTYRAAVTQYTPYDSWENGPQNILQQNFQTIRNLATEAKEKRADIIVFPEYGLTSTNLGDNRTEFLSLLQTVPELGEVPCANNGTLSNFEFMKKISCLAAGLRMYLVVNLAELQDEDDGCGRNNTEQCDEVVAFNTQVVFDRKGAVVARYRKIHLFLEPEFSDGTEPDSSAIFTTDFNVTFSLQVCFDIMFRSPGVYNILNSNVTDIAMSTAWIDELPFLTAPQIFSSWSRGLQVNLLVSNLFKPNMGELGSGIFSYVDASNGSNYYTYDASLTTPVLLVTDVTTKLNTFRNDDAVETTFDFTSEDGNQTLVEVLTYDDIELEIPNDQFIIHENISFYSYKLLESQEIEAVTDSLCYSDTFCCHIQYSKMNSSSLNSSNANYMLLAYDGIVTKGGYVYSMYTQVCAVVFCTSTSIDDCTNINSPNTDTHTSFRLHSLRANFDSKFVYPSVLNLDFKLAEVNDYDYTLEEIESEIFSAVMNVTNPWDNLLSASLFARIYELDP